MIKHLLKIVFLMFFGFIYGSGASEKKTPQEGYPFNVVDPKQYLALPQPVYFGVVLLPKPEQAKQLITISTEITDCFKNLAPSIKPEKANQIFWEMLTRIRPEIAINPHISLAWICCLEDEFHTKVKPLITRMASRFTSFKVSMKGQLETDDEADVVYEAVLSDPQKKYLGEMYKEFSLGYDHQVTAKTESHRCILENQLGIKVPDKEWREGGFLPLEEVKETFGSAHFTLVYRAAAHDGPRAEVVKAVKIPAGLRQIAITHLGVVRFAIDRNAIGGAVNTTYACMLKND